MDVAKKLLSLAFIVSALLALPAVAQDSTGGVPSQVERIARARWQPTRRVAMQQEVEPLPVPQGNRVQEVPMQPRMMPAPEPIYETEGPMNYEGPMTYEGHMPLNEGCNCSSCQSAGACDASGCDGYGCDRIGCDSSPCDAMGCCNDYCGPLPRLNLFLPLPCHGWIHAEYLMWSPRAMQIPPLVTRSPIGTAQQDAGVLGQPNTTTLVGGEMLGSQYDGARLRVGFWLDRCRNHAIQAEVFGIGEENDTRTFRGTPNNILARPFFNILNGGAQDSELVNFPGVVLGDVTVEANSSLSGVSAHWLQSYGRSCSMGPSLVDGGSTAVRRQLSFFAGWRYLNLDEDLTITENLTSQLVNDPGNFDIFDRFSTRNQFNGADLGVQMNSRRGRWSLDMLMRLALGSTRQEVDINGQTTIAGANAGNNGVFDGGLLAQTSNIGTYSRNRFSAVPELGLTLGYQLNPGWRATVGYTFLYWNNVARPGDQISTDVNPNLLPPQVLPIVGAQRPEFTFTDSDLWVNGLNLGAEYTW